MSDYQIFLLGEQVVNRLDRYVEMEKEQMGEIIDYSEHSVFLI